MAVLNARTAKKLVEAQSAAAKAKQVELEKDLQRKRESARTGSVTERELGQYGLSGRRAVPACAHPLSRSR